MDASYRLEQGEYQQMDAVQTWQQSPFQELQGGVVLQNMRVGSSNLEQVYRDMRTHLLYFNALVIGITGRNKSGKGGLGMGFWRLFHQDLYLKNQMENREIDRVEWRIIPFAHCDRAAKLPKDLYPELGLVDPEKTPQSNTTIDEAAISGLQWALAEETFPEDVTNHGQLSQVLKEQRRAIIWTIEASTPFVLPSSFLPPVRVEGEHDLGISTLCNLASHAITKRHMFLLAIDPDARLRDDFDSTEFREQSFARSLQADKLFGGSTQVVTTEANGQDVAAKDLSLEEQQRIHRLLRISMASAEAVIVQHTRKDALNQQLYKDGVIPEPTDAGFYTQLNRRLYLPSGRFIVPKNDWFGGENDYDIDYLFNSWVLQKYPQILDAA